MKKAFAYLRVSSKGQIDGDGFGRQLQSIRNYASNHRYEIAAVFQEEAISGGADKEDRPAFQAMIIEILRSGTNIVIIEDLTRLARLFRIQETLAIYLASKGVQLIAANTGENISEAMHADATRKAMVQVQGVFSEWDKAQLIKKLKLARERIRSKGNKCEGRKSYAELAPELVKEIRNLRRKPRGKGRKRTYPEIATMLNERGERTLTGREFSNKTIFEILKKASGNVA